MLPPDQALKFTMPANFPTNLTFNTLDDEENFTNLLLKHKNLRYVHLAKKYYHTSNNNFFKIEGNIIFQDVKPNYNLVMNILKNNIIKNFYNTNTILNIYADKTTYTI